MHGHADTHTNIDPQQGNNDFKMFPELFFPKVLILQSLCNWKRKSISSELFCSQRVPSLHYKKTQKHDHGSLTL